MELNTRSALTGLVFIIAVCGAVLLWENGNKRCAYGLYRTTIGFFTRRWRRFNGSFVHYRTCHDPHSWWDSAWASK